MPKSIVSSYQPLASCNLGTGEQGAQTRGLGSSAYFVDHTRWCNNLENELVLLSAFLKLHIDFAHSEFTCPIHASATMGVTFSQFFPPQPTLTEANLPSQNGKVFLVTGGYSGVGLELCRILYQAGGRVYLAGRSEAKAKDAISQIKGSKAQASEQSPRDSAGELVFLDVSLDDLNTIKPAVQKFTSTESRLDVLFNNAGVSNPPAGSVSAQGIELQMATNCLGSHLLTELLLPTLQATAKASAPGAVRVVWTSSIAVDLGAPKTGMALEELTDVPKNQQHNYVNSKTGNWFLASSLATRVGADKDGILSVTQNPGNLKTPLIRHMPAIVGILASPLLYDARYGAYTELWAGLSEGLRLEDGGGYVVPWGRMHPSPRPELLAALKSKEEGGTGVAQGFVAWCDEKIRDYL